MTTRARNILILLRRTDRLYSMLEVSHVIDPKVLQKLRECSVTLLETQGVNVVSVKFRTPVYPSHGCHLDLSGKARLI